MTIAATVVVSPFTILTLALFNWTRYTILMTEKKT